MIAAILSLIFLISIMCFIAGIGTEFDSMPSNKNAGWLLAGIAAPFMVISGAALIMMRGAA